jgi:hypothetical protein
MTKSVKRRVLGALGVVLATQLLSACVVLPLPVHRHHAVVVSPGYGYGPAPQPEYYGHPRWRR